MEPAVDQYLRETNQIVEQWLGFIDGHFVPVSPSTPTLPETPELCRSISIYHMADIREMLMPGTVALAPRGLGRIDGLISRVCGDGFRHVYEFEIRNRGRVNEIVAAAAECGIFNEGDYRCARWFPFPHSTFVRFANRLGDIWNGRAELSEVYRQAWSDPENISD